MRAEVARGDSAVTNVMGRALVGAVLVALTLTGCVRLDLRTTLTDHDTADGTLVIAVADDAAGMFGGDPADVWAQYKDAVVGDVPDAVTEEPYAEDGYTGSRYVFDDEPVATLATISDGDLRVTREGDEYVVSGVLDLSKRVEGIEEVPEGALGSVDATIELTFPGPVTETNGEVDGSTVTWHPDAEQATRLSARGLVPVQGTSAMPTAVGTPTSQAHPAEGIISDWGAPVSLATFLVLVLGGLVTYIVSRRQRSRQAAQKQA
ncbi:LppM family (lipo)protein [Promicromonospora vindobonensis]|uniref:LppM family (Lipo)protein n=1 Tax=Promicromonospora vindobonensis TaxID=195748 RepID=A0ABW5VRH0_9MICO